MRRNVFISFLGSSFYGKCRYKYDDFISSETRFVQQATLEWLNAKENAFPHEAIILLTEGEKGSKALNWNKSITERVNFQTKQKEEYIGLEAAFENLKINTIPVKIPDGKDEKEIWQIFEIIFNELKDDDKLYFDLTHGFRYLPMLLLVLGNYAKFMKKGIEIKHISYGNYEARENNIAPFVDLLSLSKLQDWTTAAADFIKFGDAKEISNLTQKETTPILKASEGKDKTASILRNLNKAILNLTKDIKTNRGNSIVSGQNQKQIIDILDNLKQELLPALSPILKKIEDDVKTIYNKEKDVNNLISSVKYCIDKNLIQEGLTILQEGIISVLLTDDYQNKIKREFVSGYLNTYKNGAFDPKRFELNSLEKEELQTFLKDYPNITNIADIFTKITANRNDINHAGLLDNATTADRLKENLEKYFQEIQSHFNLNNSINQNSNIA
jgi:CRISPR-associated Csx2 family protein